MLAYPVKQRNICHPAFWWQPHHRNSGRSLKAVHATGQWFASSSGLVLAYLKVFHSFVSYFCHLWAFSVNFVTRQWCWVVFFSSVGFSAQLWPCSTRNCDSSFLITICQGQESFCKANEVQYFKSSSHPPCLMGQSWKTSLKPLVTYGHSYSFHNMVLGKTNVSVVQALNFWKWAHPQFSFEMGSLIHRCLLGRAFLQGLVKSLVSGKEECPLQCFPAVRKNLFCSLVKSSTTVPGFTAQ